MLPQLLNRRFILTLCLAFAVWTLAAGWLGAPYARWVLALARWGTDGLYGGTRVLLDMAYPDIAWTFADASAPLTSGTVSFYLLSYNLVLYLALVTAMPATGAGRRALMALAGLPVFFVFHAADLLLAVESRRLSVVRPAGYDLAAGFDVWFLFIKFAHNFSVMAFKQVLPLLVAGLQWRFVQSRQRRV